MDITSVSKTDAVAPVSPSALSAQELALHREIVQAVRAVNEAELLGQGPELTFTRDPDTQRMIIRLVDPGTGEVVRQIPPEYVLRLAKSLRDGQKAFK